MSAELAVLPPRNETHERVGAVIQAFLELEDARPEGKERDALCDYAVAVARFFARADARGTADSTARALKAEERERLKGKSAADVMAALGALDEQARAQVREAGDKAEAAEAASLNRAGDAEFMRRVMDAWFQMDSYLRGQ